MRANIMTEQEALNKIIGNINCPYCTDSDCVQDMMPEGDNPNIIFCPHCDFCFAIELC